MSDWLPVIVGASIILVAFAIARFAPESVWGQELRRSYGVRPTGARGHRTRRDHLRSAALSGAAVVLLFAASVVGGVFADRLPDETQGHLIATTYTLVAFMLAAVATVAAVRALWKAAVWRMELPDTPDHRRAIADAIDRLLDNSLSDQDRAEYLEVRYLHPQIEQVRRATLKLASEHRSGLPEHFRAQIKQWTAGIRGSAG